MPIAVSRILFAAFAAVPFVLVQTQSQDQNKAQAPTCEQVYKNIKVLKGVPASELIPAMEFMSGSLGYECDDCHDPKDASIDTPTKETARHMILMQRDINEKNFEGRNQVTCMTCHRGSEHPASLAIPPGYSLRHKRMDNAPKPEDLVALEQKAMGTIDGALVRTGELTAPNDQTHKVETKPLELIQANGGKYRLTAGDRKIASDGKASWYGPYPLDGEPANVFERMGRLWSTPNAFAGLDRLSVSGTDKVGNTDVIVLRGSRPDANSTEEIYLDSKTNRVLRFVNARRSILGSEAMILDYSNYRKVASAQVPMTVVMTFAGGIQWTMKFDSAKVDAKIPAGAFDKPSGQ